MKTITARNLRLELELMISMSIRFSISFLYQLTEHKHELVIAEAPAGLYLLLLSSFSDVEVRI